MTKGNGEWEEVASVGDDEEALLIAGFLQAQGIPSEVEGATNTAFPDDLGAFGLSRVMVPPERADEARRLLESRERGNGRDKTEEGEADDE
jgi:Putative prokaryotic signal transducing protein